MLLYMFLASNRSGSESGLGENCSSDDLENLFSLCGDSFPLMTWSPYSVAWTFRTLATKTRRPLKIRGKARTLLHKMKDLFQAATMKCVEEECKYFMSDEAGEGYTGCNRRNGPDFGRVFLRSYYTGITQNTYIQSSMFTEILAREF